jgi:hypothetical protein
VYIFETIFIICYLILFFINSPVGGHFRYIIYKIPRVELFDLSSNLFMDWSMFRESTDYAPNIKIILETKNNLIDVYYLEDAFIKNNIPELNLKKSSFSAIINNYESHHFLNLFLKEKFDKIFNHNLKYLTIYRTFKKQDAQKPNIEPRLLYQHTYGSVPTN